MTDGAGVEVRLLGPLEVLVDGRPVAVPGGKPRVALVVLALRVGQPVSVETLADRLWGSEPPENIRGSLQSSMVRLRRALDGGPAGSCLETVRGGYRLAVDPDRVDLARFRRLAAGAAGERDRAAAREVLAAALALWRGEPLAGVDSPVLRRDELPGLVEEYLSAVERRTDLDLALGHLAELVPELRELCGRHPLRESLWARLIAVLARLGRGAEAIETYHVMRTGLAEELGVDPSAALRQQYRRLLGGEPEPGAGTAGVVAPAGAEPVRPRQVPADVAHFTGRRAELAALDRLVEGGTAGVAVLDGAAGVGKPNRGM
jgi:DNA-binding SARP family transcriptional activator